MSDRSGKDVGTRHSYAPLTTMISGGHGLPCRAEGCRAVFSRVGDGDSMPRFHEAIADRDAHELERHGLTVATGTARGERRRPSVGRHVGEADRRVTLTTGISGTHTFPAPTRSRPCRVCEMPVASPRRGRHPDYCRRCRELGRSLRRARALARVAGDVAILHAINAALAAFTATR